MAEKIREFLNFLEYRLKSELPGLEAHKKMAPLLGKKFFRKFKPAKSAKHSAVLALFTTYNSDLEILFTLRSKNISHSGQISFPGGRTEENETPEETALRETFEETGIGQSDIKIIGKMSNLYVPPSNSMISPVVGVLTEEPKLMINPYEVDEVFFIPFSSFIDDKYLKVETKIFDGLNVDVPFWDIHHSTPLWGATAMMLMELVILYQEFIKTNID